MTTNSIPRESIEFVPLTVKVDGVPVLTGVTVSVVAAGSRPGAWVAPTALAGKIGVITNGYAAGAWQVWAKVSGFAPETPVVDAGSFRVT